MIKNLQFTVHTNFREDQYKIILNVSDRYGMSGHNNSFGEILNVNGSSSLLNDATGTSGLQASEQQQGAEDSIAAHAQTSLHQTRVS